MSERAVGIKFVFINNKLVNIDKLKAYCIEKATMYASIIDEVFIVYISIMNHIEFNLCDINNKTIKSFNNKLPNNDRVLIISEKYGRYLCTESECVKILDSIEKNKIQQFTFAPYQKNPTNADAYDLMVRLV
jgi:hypothetical protein